jgi:hypothetical protein
MKKLTYFIIIASLLITPIVPVKAQTLTKNDIKIVAPQLLQVLNQLSVVIAQKQNQFEVQYITLKKIVGTTGSIVDTIKDLKSQNLSSTEEVNLNYAIGSLSKTIGGLSVYVGKIANERYSFSKSLEGTISILGSFSHLLSST